MSTKGLKKNTTFVVKPSTKGQIVVPKFIRDSMEIDNTSTLIFKFDPKEKQVYFRKQEDDIYSVFGSLGKNIKKSKPITQTEFELDLENSKTAKFKQND